MFPQLIDYLDDLVDNYGEKFLVCHTTYDFYLGQRASSRVESIHSILKRYLKVSTGDLANIVEKTVVMWSNIVAEHKFQETRDADINLIYSECVNSFIQPILKKLPNFICILVADKVIRSQSRCGSLPNDRLSSNFGLTSLSQLFNFDLFHLHWHWEHSHVPIQVPSQPQVPVSTDTTPLELLSSASLSEEQRQFVTSSLYQLVTSVQNIPFASSVKKTRGRPLECEESR
ncbi:hypothetical protein P9112_011152 [Eukaryota sp. TZLM1-RC]